MRKPPQRYGSVIGLLAGKLAEYKRSHATVWPDVARMIRRCHIRNYSIYLRKVAGRHDLFNYFEYTGKTLFTTNRRKIESNGPCHLEAYRVKPRPH